MALLRGVYSTFARTLGSGRDSVVEESLSASGTELGPGTTVPVPAGLVPGGFPMLEVLYQVPAGQIQVHVHHSGVTWLQYQVRPQLSYILYVH